MNFLSPAFLIGLPLIAVPLVIHLLSRRQQKKISWGAMRFLLQAATRKRRLWRLTDILLLLLRTAAFLFFIFALARPLLPATWLGGSIPREVILVLDQSMSMSRKANGASLFELQLQKANDILDDLTGSDTIRVLLAGESPEWLMPDSIPASGPKLRNLRAQLNGLKPTFGAADLIACVREAADLEAPKDKSARIVVVITDGQRFGWRMDERPLWAAIQARLQQSAIPTSINLQLLHESGSGVPLLNLCVNNIQTTRPFGAVNQSLSFSATVQNHSPKPSAPTLLTWRVNEQSIGVTTVPELAPGASTTLSLAHDFPAAGTFEVTCHVEANDVLPPDNHNHLLVQIFDRLPVLLVEDSVSSESLQNDAPFVLAALGARESSEWRSVFLPTVIDSRALASTDLTRFRAALLANVQKLAQPLTDKLEDYVQNGGGVWLALGTHTDERSFNDSLHRGGLGLAPLKLTGAVGDPNDRERFFTIRASSDSHPATTLLADFQRLDLDRARVYRRHQFDPFSGKDVSVLLQAQAGEPVVVERKLGRGRVIVQGFPLGVSWSTLPLCQAYVAMLHEWLWYLTEPGLPRRNLAVGEALIEVAAKPNTTAELTLPDGRKLELTAASSQFRCSATRLPGEYTLQTKAGVTKFHVTRNPQESDLKPFTDQDRQQLAEIKTFQINADLNAIGSTAKLQIPRHPLEGFLLTALAIVLLAELALAGWSTHRRNLRIQPATMEGT